MGLINNHYIELSKYIELKQIENVRLHLGCGGVRWENFINVDFYPQDDFLPDSSRNGCLADVYADIRALGLPNCTVDEIFTSHTFEHFTKWEGIDMLRDWHRMLRQGGRLVIEMPDFWRCVIWLFHPLKKKRELGRTQFYGNQWDRHEFETHRYLWSSSEIVGILSGLGFSEVKISHCTETHHPWRDMRVETIK